MNIFKQRRGTGLLLIVVAALSFVAARVTHTLPVGSVVWADSAKAPHATVLAPETSGSTLGVDPSRSLSMSRGVGAEAVGEPPAGIAPSLSMPVTGALNGPTPQFQGQAGAGGLTVSAVGSVTWPADEAYVIIVPEPYYGSSGPEPLASEDKKDVLDNLARLGIEESAVEFMLLGRYDPTSISVEIDLADSSVNAAQVVEAVKEVVRQLEFHGVRYVLSAEHCHQALALARRQAIPGAQQAADDLAEAIGAVRGNATNVLEYPVNTFSQVWTNADRCSSQNTDSYSHDIADMTHLESEQEVTVSVGLQVTYSMQ